MPTDDTTSADRLAEEALGWIVRLHSGTASEDERRAFGLWRSTSGDHEKAAREAEALWADMSGLHADAASGFVLPGESPRGASRRTVLFAALGFGGAAAGGAALWQTGMLTRLSADYATAPATSRVVSLEDGSRITLNARSAMNVRFSPKLRRIDLLQGQAFFEVLPDPARPFEVMADGVSVVALGTAFDVVRDLPGVRAEVAVTEHAVRVSVPGSVQGGPVDLSQGQSVAIDGAGGIGGVRPQDVAVTSAWRQGLYIAEDRSLDEVVAALSAWRAGPVFFAQPALKALRVNAVLDLGDPDGSLMALQEGLPIRVRQMTPFLTVITGA